MGADSPLPRTILALLGLMLLTGSSHGQGFVPLLSQQLQDALTSLANMTRNLDWSLTDPSLDWFYTTRPGEELFHHPAYPTPNCSLLSGWKGYDCTFSDPNSIALLSTQSLTYCKELSKNWGSQSDTSCDFTGLNETVYLDTRRKEDEEGHKLLVKNVNVLSYFATCGFTLTLDGVKHLLVTSVAWDPTAPKCHNDNDLFARSINADELQYNFRKLELIDSSVEAIRSSVEVETMFLLRSNVRQLYFEGSAVGDEYKNRYSNGIENVHIQLNIENSIVDSIGLIKSRSSLWSVGIQNSSVGTIEQSAVVINQELGIYGSTIHKVTFNGVIGDDGSWMILNDTIIEDMDNHAIIMDGNSNLHFNNVIIKKCRVPCIAVQKKKNLWMTNVTINGEVVHEDSSAFLFHDSLSARGYRQVSWIDDEGCAVEKTRLTCNLDNFHEPIIMSSDTLRNYTRVNMINVNDLALYYECGKPSFRMVNVAGTVYPRGHGDLTCTQQLDFSFFGSLLQHLHPSSPAQVEVAYSFIALLSSSSSLTLHLDTTIINTLRNVTLLGTPQVWFNATIGELQDVIIEANLNMTKTVIKSLKNVLVNKSLTLSEVTLMGDLTVTKFGHLIWTNFTFNSSVRGQITLEPEATLRIKDIELSLEELAHKVFSANNYDQVVEFPPYEEFSVWLPDLVMLRPPQEHLLGDLQEPLLKVTLKDDRFCLEDEINNDTVICDYSSASSANIEHDMSLFKYAYVSERSMFLHYNDADTPTAKVVYPYHTNSNKKIRFVNADVLQLDQDFPYQFNVTIENVKKVYPIKVVFSSPLTLMNSRAMLIDMLNSATLTVQDSSVNYLALDHHQNADYSKSLPHDLYLNNSTVKKLHITVNDLRVESSKLKEIIKCKIRVEAEVSSTDIGTLSQHAVFVERGASLQLMDVTIDEIQEGGLVVEGSLFMKDVVIKRLDRHGLILGRNARSITFENVVIESGLPNSIVNLNTKVITVSNMTLNGKSHFALSNEFDGEPNHFQVEANDHSAFDPYIFNNGTHRMLGFLEAEDGQLLTELMNSTGSVLERKYVALDDWMKANEVRTGNSLGNFSATVSTTEVTSGDQKHSLSLTTKKILFIEDDITPAMHVSLDETAGHSRESIDQTARAMNTQLTGDLVTRQCSGCGSSTTELPTNSSKPTGTIADTRTKEMSHNKTMTGKHQKHGKADKVAVSRGSDHSSAIRNELVALVVVVVIIASCLAFYGVRKRGCKKVSSSDSESSLEDVELEDIVAAPHDTSAREFDVHFTLKTVDSASEDATSAASAASADRTSDQPLVSDAVQSGSVASENGRTPNGVSRVGRDGGIEYSAIQEDRQEVIERHNENLTSVSGVSLNGEVTYKNFK